MATLLTLLISVSRHFSVRYSLLKRLFLLFLRKKFTSFYRTLGAESLKLRTRLSKLFENYLPACKLRVVFKCNTRMSSFFKFKDRVNRALRSKVVYKFTCGGCNASYIGKTMRHLNVRASEHIGISALTQKRVKCKRSAVSDHLLVCDSLKVFPLSMTSVYSPLLTRILSSNSKRVYWFIETIHHSILTSLPCHYVYLTNHILTNLIGLDK